MLGEAEGFSGGIFGENLVGGADGRHDFGNSTVYFFIQIHITLRAVCTYVNCLEITLSPNSQKCSDRVISENYIIRSKNHVITSLHQNYTIYELYTIYFHSVC